MTLVIRHIAVDSFRKFRTPFALEGLSEGLNIVIEPNETGKSTLLGALRAAFFIRHGTHNRLAQSFAPYGEAVGPEIKVTFEVAGVPWAINKRFLRSPTFELTGPNGRAQGDDAETQLNALLGSVRDNSRDWEPSAYGALGLLWVAQAEALSVSGPGQIVRDTIASTLEAEIGSIMGGETYRRVRQRVDAQFDLYWSPSGQKRGRQKEASDRLAAAEAISREAGERLATLERSFADLESAQARLRIIEREIADETDNQSRKNLVETLEVARAAAQILATRHAENETAIAKLSGLNDLKTRHTDAVAARETASSALAEAKDARTRIAENLIAARAKVATARTELAEARAERQAARAALAAGEDTNQRHLRRSATSAARERHGNLLELEAQYRGAEAVSHTALDAKVLADLEENDRELARAQAVVSAGATRLILSGETAGITIDGEPMVAGERTLTSEARIAFAKSELIVSPPDTAASAEEALRSAIANRQATLDDLGIADLAEARARNDAARDAAAELRTLEARIEALTPADEAIALSAGPEALKLFVTESEPEEVGEDAETPDLALLKQEVEKTETRLARAEGEEEAAISALERAEAEDAPLALALADAESDLKSAEALIQSIEQRDDWGLIDANLKTAREDAAGASVALEAAKQNAAAHDVAAISRKIEIIDARARTTAEGKTKLETEVARLEATIESEGGLGLADRAAAAQDELAAAGTALQRVTDDADTLKLLRDTLDTARLETSAKFVGPVARRAKRYIERLLPDCELTFSEDLTLESIVRGGVSEECSDLSQGTREQLAVLTRIAFADMLLEQGKPVSLILDDPLVYSDDARLDTMIEILTEAATRMQVILLTCRDRAFRHVAANRIAL